MGDGDERRSADDMPAASDNVHDGVVIEGLRAPLTRAQRLRRSTIASAAIAGVLAVLLWPALSSLLGAFPAKRPMAQATATSGFPWQSAGGVSIVVKSTVEITVGPAISMCPVTPQTPSSLGLPEMHADTIGNGDVWALLLAGSKIPANQDVKIVWRATGSGTFRLVARDDAGTQLSPVSGPDVHLGSNWQSPGEEWGTVFNFPRAGCWQLQVTRGGDLSANIWLAVSS